MRNTNGRGLMSPSYPVCLIVHTVIRLVNQSHIKVLSKKIILLLVELPCLMVPLAEGRQLKVEKDVGSIKACGEITKGLIVSLLCMTLEEFHQVYVELAHGMGPSAIERLSVEG